MPSTVTDTISRVQSSSPATILPPVSMDGQASLCRRYAPVKFTRPE